MINQHAFVHQTEHLNQSSSDWQKLLHNLTQYSIEGIQYMRRHKFHRSISPTVDRIDDRISPSADKCFSPSLKKPRFHRRNSGNLAKSQILFVIVDEDSKKLGFWLACRFRSQLELYYMKKRNKQSFHLFNSARQFWKTQMDCRYCLLWSILNRMMIWDFVFWRRNLVERQISPSDLC